MCYNYQNVVNGAAYYKKPMKVHPFRKAANEALKLDKVLY